MADSSFISCSLESFVGCLSFSLELLESACFFSSFDADVDGAEMTNVSDAEGWLFWDWSVPVEDCWESWCSSADDTVTGLPIRGFTFSSISSQLVLITSKFWLVLAKPGNGFRFRSWIISSISFWSSVLRETRPNVRLSITPCSFINLKKKKKCF